MVPKLVTVAPEDDVFHGIRLLLNHRITGAPVIDAERRYLGMLSEKSCLSVLTLTASMAEDNEVPHLAARDFMAKKLLTLSPDDDSVAAAEYDALDPGGRPAHFADVVLVEPDTHSVAGGEDDAFWPDLAQDRVNDAVGSRGVD